ncbi:MAG: hypothetical protein ACTSYW_09740 [Candidatus Heimdallarchaeota archaeon]
MKGKKEKISVMFLFLILLGANVANLQLISSVVPKHDWREPTEQVFEKKVSRNDAHELDYQTLVEVSEYILDTAEHNNYQFDCVVYSAALLFESEDALIIIGHGYFDSKQQYFIGDYSERAIQKMAHGRDIVALLACYSATIVLTNKKQLTYQNSIDLLTAIKDLGNNLAWVQKSIFTPLQNILLSDLDSGGVNGWSLRNPPPIFNVLRQAHTYDGKDIYWNLFTEAGINSLSYYMRSHKYRLMEFTFIGEFLIEVSENSYMVERHTVEFESWILTKSDTKDYFHVEDIYIDGEYQSRQRYDYKVDDLLDAMVTEAGIANRVTALGIMAGAFVTMGVFLLGKGISWIGMAAAAAAASKTVTALGFSVGATSFLGWFATIVGAVLLVAVIALVITAVVIAFTWD